MIHGHAVRAKREGYPSSAYRKKLEKAIISVLVHVLAIYPPLFLVPVKGPMAFLNGETQSLSMYKTAATRETDQDSKKTGKQCLPRSKS